MGMSCMRVVLGCGAEDVARKVGGFVAAVSHVSWVVIHSVARVDGWIVSAAGAIATFAFCRNSFPWPLHGCLFNLAIFAPSPYVTGAVIFPLAAAPWATALASTWWRPPPLWYPTVRQPRRRRGMMSSGSTACRWGGSYCSVRIWEHMMSSGINACRSGPVVVYVVEK
eukprot:1138678-Pelagomonas_calceolata.AAC.11